MTGRTALVLLGLLAAFGLGFALGRNVGRQETADSTFVIPQVRPRALGPTESPADPVAAETPANRREIQEDPKPTPEAEEATSPARDREPEREFEADLARIDLAGPDGELLGPVLGVTLAAQDDREWGRPVLIVAAPLEPVRRASIGTARFPGLPPLKIVGVQASDPILGLAFLAVPSTVEPRQRPYVRLAGELMTEGEFLRAVPRGSWSGLSVRVRSVRRDPDLDADVTEIEPLPSWPEGGFLRSADRGLAGLIQPPLMAFGPRVHRLAVSTFERAERHRLELPDFRRIFFAGSLQALRESLRRALDMGEAGKAVVLWREAGPMAQDPRLAELSLEVWTAAVQERGRRLGTAGRFECLLEAVAALPAELSFQRDLARLAPGSGRIDEAVAAIEQAMARALPRDGEAAGLVLELRLQRARDLAATGAFEAGVGVLRDGLRFQPSAEYWQFYAKLLEKLRLYADAAAALQSAALVDPGLAAELAEHIARNLRLMGGRGRVVVDYEPGSRRMVARLTLNGSTTGEFLIDTGATSTVVPEGVARAAGIVVDNRSPRVRVQTAGGSRDMHLGAAGRLSMGDLAVDGLDVIVGDLPGFGQRGLLGMDFLSRFGFENDAENGRFVIFER